MELKEIKELLNAEVLVAERALDSIEEEKAMLRI